MNLAANLATAFVALCHPGFLAAGLARGPIAGRRKNGATVLPARTQ